MDATITVQRKPSFIGMLRPITVYVDGKKAAAVKNGQDCSFSLAPGRHEIETKGSLWAKSQKIPIDVQSGAKLDFECGIMTQYVVPVFVGGLSMFLVSNFAAQIVREPLLFIATPITMVVFLIYALAVSFRRNMMYYLTRK
jgi:hypothetical protein